MIPHPDVLFVAPNDRVAYQGLANEQMAIETPLWAGMLAQVAREAHLHVAILDAKLFDLSPGETARRIVDDYGAQLVVFVAYGHQPNASTQTIPFIAETCRVLRGYSSRPIVAAVGGHVAALPYEVLDETGIDCAAFDEGLRSIPALASELQTLGAWEPGLTRTGGFLWSCGFLSDGKRLYHQNVPPPRLLSGVPEVAYDLMPPLRAYRAHNWQCLDGSPRSPYASVYASLGCPAHCYFCCIQAPFRSNEAASGLQRKQNSYRLKDPEIVLGEFDYLADRGVRVFKIADELFVGNKAHVERICEGLARRPYAGELNIWAYTRVDTCKDECLLALMREAGIRWLCPGIESASQDVLKESRKRGGGADAARKAVEACRAAGIHVIANYMVGLPGDTAESMEQTFQLACELNTEWLNLYCAMAMPGSELYADKVKAGWQPPPWSAFAPHAYDHEPLPTEALSSADVLRFRDNAVKRYFERPEYLAMLERTFGPRAVEIAKATFAVPLRRKLLGD